MVQKNQTIPTEVYCCFISELNAFAIEIDYYSQSDLSKDIVTLEQVSGTILDRGLAPSGGLENQVFFNRENKVPNQNEASRALFFIGANRTL